MKDNIAMNEMDELRMNDGYDDLLLDIRKSFDKRVKDGAQLFTTDAHGLYDLILSAIPSEARQHYNCNACRSFVNKYGGLVTINEKGSTTPVMWSGNYPPFFDDAVERVYKRVKSAKVTGVFITSNKVLGTPVTGSWKHMAVDMPKDMVYRNRVMSDYQALSEKAEDRRILAEAVGKYKIDTVETALNLLRSETLYRSEKVLGVAEWFLDVLKATKKKNSSRNILWLKAATAPTGFCHVSSSMIGTLLDDIEAGYSFEAVSKRFSEKMNPLQYQRPQAAPSAGNVQKAEKIVEKLGIENSLKRRFARLDELETIWRPSVAKRKSVSTGVFAGVKTKQETEKSFGGAMDLPNVTMTWEKFNRTVLREARKIEYLVTGKPSNFGAILTAEDLSAPPIIQWDREDRRNPFNWYVYSNGSYPGNWCLSRGYVEVTGVALQPNLWNEGYEHGGKSVFFILEGAKDNRYEGSGIALFPEVLKSELREVRSTIEAYSRSAVLGGCDDASACGIRLQSGGVIDAKFRVTTDIGVTEYTIDRWD